MKGGGRRSEMMGGKKVVVGGGGAPPASWILLLLLLPVLFLLVLKTDFLPQNIARLRETSVTIVADEMAHKVSALGLDVERWHQQQPPLNDDAAVKSQTADHDSPAVLSGDEIMAAGSDLDASRDSNQPGQILPMNGKRDDSLLNSDVVLAAPRSKLSCNFSSKRTNVCAMEGDVRIHGKSAAVYVIGSSDYWPENATAPVVIRPYPRKWEAPTMKNVREVTIRSSGGSGGAGDGDAAVPVPPPRCTVTHDVPAVVFSTGGYSANYFHAMTDVVIPLYITAREYDGRVQLLATDYDRKWIAKFRPILAGLSVYTVIDFDADFAVRCFPSARVGLEGHKELGISPGLSRNGYTMMDFRDFLRSAYSLKRAWSTPVAVSLPDTAGEKKRRRPRLVMLLRRHSRALTNEDEAVSAATDIGFEVVPARPEDVRDMARFAGVVNSCDVMVGVHGAGLTNMVFLPHNGTVVQIIPWGGMKWPCWHAFGQPAPEMGLRYVEYEATAEETTLKEVYPRDHAVFADPMSIHRQGFGKLWTIFLNGQNVTLDIDRFKAAMQQVYQSVTVS